MISGKARHRIYVGLSGVGFLCITLAFTANSQVKTETEAGRGLASQIFKIETAPTLR